MQICVCMNSHRRVNKSLIVWNIKIDRGLNELEGWDVTYTHHVCNSLLLVDNQLPISTPPICRSMFLKLISIILLTLAAKLYFVTLENM